ncbi:MAG: HD domain-containing phosphohydrolase [Desulfuromonadales bacterium]
MKTLPHILVVDDIASNLRLMEAILTPLGYKVFLAHDGMEALEAVKENTMDLILLDAMMPRMDGFETARRLKSDEDTQIIPIVMVTDLSRVEDKVKALEAGVDDLLTKPVDKSEVRSRVASLLKVKAYNDQMRNYQKDLEAELAARTHQLREAFEKIKLSSLDTIYRLSKAAEYKDEDTGAHIVRMSNYSAVIARKMGLTERAAESLLYAAPLHDIGKIGIPDKVLLKSAKLDPEEWDIMKKHPVMGAKILEKADTVFIRLGEIIAMTHHEKWDGSGYPKGLKGKEIPLVGRIVAIADVFDALTSKRPYKQPFPIEKALAIIREDSGSHFDPAVVDAFFACKEEILSIKEKFSEEQESLLYKLSGKFLQ